jgi:hypothetical protein
MTVQERIDAHRAAQLKKRLYAVFWINDPNSTRAQHLEVLPDHLDFLMDLEKQGILFASGPFSVPDGMTQTFNGMTILRADSHAAVQKILEREPFVASGLRTYQLHAWDLNEGSFTVTLSFGSGTYQVP